MRYFSLLLVLLMLPLYADNPKGLWLTARKDTANWARADVPASMATAPKEIWCYPTGGEVSFARLVKIGGEEALLARAGTTLQLLSLTGQPIWQHALGGILDVLLVDDFDGDGKQEVLHRTDSRTVALLELATGETLWSWQAAPSTFISGYAIERTLTGLRFICFPQYSTDGYCFDFSAQRTAPRLVWKRSYEGKYDAGFGPSIVLHDMNGDGQPELVLSGKKGQVYQAVLDAGTGEILYDLNYAAGEQSGRPYGLLQVVDLDRDRKPEIVMAGCQVEEYLGIARNEDGNGLRMRWGQFIEKDWPEDDKELRPQITSLSDVRGNGKVELIVGLWENGAWRTAIIDPLQGFEARRGELERCFFWGCYDITGDGVPEIIVSREEKRTPGRITTLQAIDGNTLQPVATLEHAGLLTTSDSPLPADRFFMALRSNPVPYTTADGVSGILVFRFKEGEETGLYLWGARKGAAPDLQPVAPAGQKCALPQASGLLLADARGHVQRYDANLHPVGDPITVNGRTCRIMSWVNGNKRELVFDIAGGQVMGGVPDLRQPGALSGAWSVTGSMPALHIDAAGISRLSVADTADSDNLSVRIYPSPAPDHLSPVEIPLAHPAYLGLTPYGSEFRLLVNLQTGVHTMALACYDVNGKLLWEDKQYGGHPQIPGVADLNGDGREEVIADDHGVLRIHDEAGKVLGSHPGWPPAYTLPISGPFGPGGTPAVLRASGISGFSLNDINGKAIWLKDLGKERIFRWYYSSAAVGNLDGHGQYAAGLLTDEGLFECWDARTGQMLWTLPLDEGAKGTSIIAGDLDGDGADEFLLGLPNGRLLCIDQQDGKGIIRWEMQLDAAIVNPILADIDSDGLSEIILSTADGLVRVLK